MDEREIHWREIHVTGDQLVGAVKDLVHEGNVRRIIVRNEDGHTLLEIPLTVGVGGAMLLPIWAALGAVGALVSGFTLLVETVEVPVDDAPDEHLAHVT
jgi:hypothetical protein